MALGEPPTYTVAELERIARAFVAERLGDSVSIPVDIDLLVETTEGVDLDYWPGLRGRGLEGMVACDPATRQVVIFVDDLLADRQPTRYRMTVAEELAHLLLHRKLIDQVCDAKDFVELQGHYRWHQNGAKRQTLGCGHPDAGRCCASRGARDLSKARARRRIHERRSGQEALGRTTCEAV